MSDRDPRGCAGGGRHVWGLPGTPPGSTSSGRGGRKGHVGKVSRRLAPRPRGLHLNPQRSSPARRLSQVIGLPRDGEVRAGGRVGPPGAGLPRSSRRFRRGGRERGLGPAAAAGWGTRTPGRGRILGPLAQPSRRLPGLTHPRRSHKQAPHCAGPRPDAGRSGLGAPPSAGSPRGARAEPGRPPRASRPGNPCPRSRSRV